MLAGLFVCSSNSLRPRVLRPQLKRDPLGGDTTRTTMRAPFVALSAGLLACSPSAPPPRMQEASHRDTALMQVVDTTNRKVSEFRIPHIEAHLIFDDGQLSEDIIGEHPWVLWNTIIGEGDATDHQTGVHHPSEATLVRVVVSGPPNRTLPGAKVKLLVVGLGPSDTTIKATVVPPESMQSGAHSVPVTLPGFGAGPSHIVLEADLESFDSTGTQFIPFRLDGTGCEPIKLSAQLITDRPVDSLDADIPFECGE